MGNEMIVTLLEARVGRCSGTVQPEKLRGLIADSNGQPVCWWHVAEPGKEPGVKDAPTDFDAVIGVAAACFSENPECLLSGRAEEFIDVLAEAGYTVVIRGPFEARPNGEAHRFPAGVRVCCIWLYPKLAYGYAV